MKNLAFFFLLLLTTSAFSQDFLNSRKSSYYTYIFKLSDEESKNIARYGTSKVDDSYFHTLVDSVATDNFQVPDLEGGNYLKLYTFAENLYIQSFTIQDFYVDIVNNDVDINIKVFDNSSNIISDAIVKLNDNKLKFDNKTQTYRIKNSNRRGLLSVKYDNKTIFLRLNRGKYNPYIFRAGKAIYYSQPMRVVRNALYYSKSMVFHPFRTTGYLFRNFIQFFDFRTKFINKFTGYFVFNKPKYKPGDTVMLKAFIVNKKGNPYGKDLDLVLTDWSTGKRIKLSELEPYRKGAYKYEFVLNDSLDLTLDSWKYLYLERRKNKYAMQGSFYYEEYELKESKFEIRQPDNEQFDDQQYAIYLKATDENDLNLLDAKVDIYCKTSYSTETYDDLVFIADTFFTTNIKLDELGETKVVIPDSLMPKANFMYSIIARMSTSDNEIRDKTIYVNYFANKHNIDYRFSEDSIEFYYQYNDIEIVKDFSITAYDVNSKVISNQNVTLPYKIKINYAIRSYNFYSPEFSNTINLQSAPSSLESYKFRKNDSVYISVYNPRKIPFNYFIYKGDKEIERGLATELEYKNKASRKKLYSLEIEYLWAGDIVEISEQIPLFNKLLNIDVAQPELIYPGQNVDIEITVTDAQGSPVEDVDLTAYSLTKKFAYTPPSLPYFGTAQKSRNEINNFYLATTQLNNSSVAKALDFKKWNSEFGLDSIEYYKFLYPDSGLYSYSYNPENGKTQFSPFVVQNGKILPIYAIYVDNIPVYISWTTTQIPYSFEITNPQYAHYISIRTSENLINIGNYKFVPNTKTIISIDLDVITKNNPENYTIYFRNKSININYSKQPKNPTNLELNNLQNYLFVYRSNFGNDIAWLEQDGKYFQLNSYNNYTNSITGPVKQQNTNLKHYYNTSTDVNFLFEPMFEYEFDFPKIRMRTKIFPNYFNTKSNTSLSDEIITKQDIDLNFKNLVLNLRKSGYNVPYEQYGSYYYYNNINFNKLQINLTGIATPLNIIIVDDVTKDVCISAGSTRNFNYLSSNEQKVIFLYDDGKYFIKDSVFLKPFGNNYLKINQPDVFLKDSFSIFCDDLLNKNCFNKNYTLQTSISEFLKNAIEYTTLEGNVFTKEGTAIEGVTVVSSQFKNQTLTDIKGYFKIEVKKGEILTFSKSGYDNFTISSFITDSLQIFLTTSKIIVNNYLLNNFTGSTGSIAGKLIDEYGMGIPGATIRIKDFSEIGTITDIDGNYTITNVPYEATTLVFSFVGMENQEISISGQNIINATLYNSNIGLDEVVVTAMGIKKSEKKLAYSVQAISNDFYEVEEEALSGISGKVDGVNIAFAPGASSELTLRGVTSLSQINIKGASYDMDFFNSAMASSGIRSDFSDYAFWQPQLLTDENGKAKFSVTFPDDVTNWKTYVLAMNSKKQTGQTEGSIKSYKPLMAQLALPNFAVSGDKVGAIGKSLNYTPDIYNITTNLEVNDSTIWTRQSKCENAVIDTLIFTADDSDTMKIKYFMETEAGYFDGEERDLPIYPVGVQLAKGEFYSFDTDTVFKLDLSNYEGDIEFTAMADVFDVFLYETANVISYQYYCNEQLASKLFALLTEKTIKEFKGMKFWKNDDVKEVIKKLVANQNDEKLWGWWNRGKTSEWLSMHVIKALRKAKNAGYDVNIDFEAMKNLIIWKLESDGNFANIPLYIQLLKDFDVDNMDFSKYIEKYDNHFTTYYVENKKQIPPQFLFNIIEMKQICNIDVEVDTIFDYMYSTMYGNKYFSTQWENYYIYHNRTTLTLAGYRILKRAGGYNDILQKIRSYFFEKDGGCYWRNTYETALIIENILPEYMNGDSKITKPELTFSGAINQTVTEFPFTATIKSGETLTMEKDGIFPAYLSVYQRYWETKPSENTEYFDVETDFYDVKLKTIRPCCRYWYYNRNIRQYIPVDTLNAGEPLILRTTVTVKKDAEYVQIEIPIPAGCSYTSKPNSFWNEEHREYFENKTSIFCEKLTKGTYTFEVELTPRYTGTYTLNPAKAELMYFPIFYGNNEIKVVEIGE